MYEEKWCSRCIHRGKDDGPGCPIMLASHIFNYDAVRQEAAGKPELKNILDILIPEDDDGFAGKCSMFVEGVKVHSGPIPTHYKEWARNQGLVEVGEEQFKTLPK